ncbi:MAG: hypothetical protein CV087_16635 [Candidatus Brocadia sp. WS118]|nr:MAG: hypothetical protein CV087_16635 [Candidatus Brocadia sp. WS118]
MVTKNRSGSYTPPSLFFILKRFRKHSEKIQCLFNENDSFRSLCEDYQVCAKALKYWSHSRSSKAPTRREEYSVLLQELEEEVLIYLGGVK